MKNFFAPLIFSACLLAACSGNQPKEQEHSEDTHVHDDGTVHDNHEADSVTQEEFTAPVDSTSKETGKEHTHENEKQAKQKHSH